MRTFRARRRRDAGKPPGVVVAAEPQADLQILLPSSTGVKGGENDTFSEYPSF